MARYSIEDITLTGIADAIRAKTGGTDFIVVEDIADEIGKIKIGGGGVELPTLTNEGSASDILFDKEFIDGSGNIITGAMPNNGAISSTMDGIDVKSVTIPTGYTSGGTVSLTDDIDNEVNTQAELLAQAVAALEGKAAGGGGGEVITNTCTITVIPDYIHEGCGYQGTTGAVIHDSNAEAQYTIEPLCNSLVYFFQTAYNSASITAGEIVSEQWGGGFVYRTPNEANISVTINIVTE